MNNKNTTNYTESEIIKERRKRIFSVRTFVFLALSIFLVVFLLWKIEIGQALSTIANASIPYVIMAFLLYLLSNYCKALRYNVMLRNYNVDMTTMFAITSYQNFFNQIMPARTGELTLVYYLKTLGHANISKGLHVLLITRIYDLIIVAAFFVGSLVVYYGQETSGMLLGLGIGFFILSVVVLFYMKWITLFSKKVYDSLLKLFGLNKKKFFIRLDEKLYPLIREFIDYETSKQVVPLIITSLMVWIVLYVFAYVTILAYYVEINFLLSIAGSTGQVLANVLPVNSFGSFGTLEAGWAGGYMLVGMDKQDAITTAFGYHIINFAASGLFALMCYGIIIVKNKRIRNHGDIQQGK